MFALIGFAVGYRLEISRAAYVTMALTAVSSALGQIAFLFATQSREAMTLLPLVTGLVLTLFMFIRAVVHVGIRWHNRVFQQ